MLRFALPVFVGSALLFAVQPMLGRALLPAFGGTAGVWTACLVAYQLLLLAGSVYADRLVRARRCRAFHLAVLVVSFLWLGAIAIRGGAIWTPSVAGENATEECLSALLAVVAAIGLPYVALGANSALLQKWAAESGIPGREAYRLYAVSNAGSFVGLLAYPLLVEPYVDISWQWAAFAALFLLYAFLCARAAGARSLPHSSACELPTSPSPHSSQRVGLSSVALWFALPALSTALLNATTTHLSTDVSPIPLMWAVLLAAFLLSYTVGFTRLGERLLPLWLLLGALSAWKASSVLSSSDNQNIFVANFAAGVAVIFLGGLFLHSWLCRLRPGADSLTAYYLCIALGGAIGGLLSGIVPVFVFTTALEYPLALLLLACAVTAALATTLAPGLERLHAVLFPRATGMSPALRVVLLAAAPIFVGMSLLHTAASPYEKIYERGRNFYGCWSVVRDRVLLRDDRESGFEQPHYDTTVLLNGKTSHGVEAEESSFRGRPTSYYGQLGGGLAFTLHPKYAVTNSPLSVAIVGMGAGTQAWYGRPGDRIVFYEINPAMVAAARKHFDFLGSSKAAIEIVGGDARKALEREAACDAEKYDVLVIDAYSGDSIPYHLVTREAFELYASRIRPDGILALHITNWHVDLLPICKAAAAHLEKKKLGVESQGGLFTWDSQWVFLSEAPLKAPEGCFVQDWGKVRDVPLPSDGHGSLLPYTTLLPRRQ